MSYYNKQEYEFVKRTKTIIEQYEKFHIDKNEKYEVTLFINCLVGLLIIPKEYWFDSLPTEIVSENEWGISTEDIDFIKEDETKNIKNIAKHIRNSLAHYRFEMYDDIKNKLNEIEFMDEYRGSLTFKARISVDSLRKFTNKLTDIFLSEMEKSK